MYAMSDDLYLFRIECGHTLRTLRHAWVCVADDHPDDPDAHYWHAA